MHTKQTSSAVSPPPVQDDAFRADRALMERTIAALKRVPLMAKRKK